MLDLSHLSVTIQHKSVGISTTIAHSSLVCVVLVDLYDKCCHFKFQIYLSVPPCSFDAGHYQKFKGDLPRSLNSSSALKVKAVSPGLPCSFNDGHPQNYKDRPRNAILPRNVNTAFQRSTSPRVSHLTTLWGERGERAARWETLGTRLSKGRLDHEWASSLRAQLYGLGYQTSPPPEGTLSSFNMSL